ncbi:hypothetical protein MPNT_10096 [Candidatus Methylacidithermus pantelleriae]|uniref:Uncharacterized protein n=1 Tax=Candidatus Methylacidithermus pantelleriae TaxID=2744239 RepID=A0A8J2BH29_9BACT|nr:hypothetical protein MPNT_10096 [Candidatus Methylacidithermus pantelleriae]
MEGCVGAFPSRDKLGFELGEKEKSLAVETREISSDLALGSSEVSFRVSAGKREAFDKGPCDGFYPLLLCGERKESH